MNDGPSFPSTNALDICIPEDLSFAQDDSFERSSDDVGVNFAALLSDEDLATPVRSPPMSPPINDDDDYLADGPHLGPACFFADPPQTDNSEYSLDFELDSPSARRSLANSKQSLTPNKSSIHVDTSSSFSPEPSQILDPSTTENKRAILQNVADASAVSTVESRGFDIPQIVVKRSENEVPLAPSIAIGDTVDSKTNEPGAMEKREQKSPVFSHSDPSSSNVSTPIRDSSFYVSSPDRSVMDTFVVHETSSSQTPIQDDPPIVLQIANPSETLAPSPAADCELKSGETELEQPPPVACGDASFTESNAITLTIKDSMHVADNSKAGNDGPVSTTSENLNVCSDVKELKSTNENAESAVGQRATTISDLPPVKTRKSSSVSPVRTAGLSRKTSAVKSSIPRQKLGISSVVENAITNRPSSIARGVSADADMKKDVLARTNARFKSNSPAGAIPIAKAPINLQPKRGIVPIEGKITPKPAEKSPRNSLKVSTDPPKPPKRSSDGAGRNDLLIQIDKMLPSATTNDMPTPVSTLNSNPPADVLGQQAMQTTARDLNLNVISGARTQDAEAEISDLKARLAAAESEKAKLKEEVVFLEHLREQEAKINSLTHGEVLKEKKGDLATKEDIEKARKEMLEQETLIKGYQLENEKLTEQIKIFKKQIKDEDSRSFLRIEALQREVQTLKTALNNPSNPASSYDSAKLAATVDDLQDKLSSQERNFKERELSMTGEISKLKAQLNEANAKVEAFSGCTVEEVAEMKKTWESERGSLESYIVELELRVEKECSMKELLLLEKRQLSSESLPDVPVVRGSRGVIASKGSSTVSKGLSSQSDKRVKELEKQVADLQEKLAKATVSDTISTNRSGMDEATYIKHLKDHVRRLQSEIESKENTWRSKLEILHEETSTLKGKYEAKLQEIQVRMEETQKATAQAITSATSINNVASANHIQDIEKQLECLLEKYHEKLTEATDAEIADHLSNSDSRIVLAYKSREAKLRTRIIELENLLDSQATTMEQMRSDRAAAERESQTRSQMKDALVASYEAKIANLRKEFHEQVFGGEEQKLLSEVHRMRMEIEGLRGQNADLANKLQISEATRQSVQENTIFILKQAQEESAKIAVSHHQRALNMLREETKSQTAALLDAEVRKLKKALDDAEVELTRWQNRVANLEKEKQSWKSNKGKDDNRQEAERMLMLEQKVKELQTLNADLQNQLQKARAAWPSDRRKFNELEIALAEIELKFRKRESDLQDVIAETRKDGEAQVARLKAKYVPLLEKRDKELRYFQEQVFELVREMERMNNSA
ncbi:hypothetical protein HDU84_008231 [Entophlyctis sp. JEL0112]|nr:hypothetical protein HDU84_008231 [Entophlyctis sp. JEL0112]